MVVPKPKTPRFPNPGQTGEQSGGIGHKWCLLRVVATRVAHCITSRCQTHPPEPVYHNHKGFLGWATATQAGPTQIIPCSLVGKVKLYVLDNIRHGLELFLPFGM